MGKKFLVLGLLAAILIVPLLALGVLVLATQEGRTAPLVITGLIATDASYIRSGQIDLVWSPSDAKDFAYYSVYASETEITDVTGLFPVGRINDRADVTYQVTEYWIPGLSLALVEDTEYWFVVTAVDLAGNESEIGTSVSATIEKMPPSLIQTVFMKTNYYGGFLPAIITVPIGTTVSWSDLDATNLSRYTVPNPHTVTSDTGLFHGELRGLNDIFTYTFTEAGVFGYHCEFHPWKTGKVIVE